MGDKTLLQNEGGRLGGLSEGHTEHTKALLRPRGARCTKAHPASVQGNCCGVLPAGGGLTGHRGGAGEELWE